MRPPLAALAGPFCALLLLIPGSPAAAQEDGIALGAVPQPVVLEDLDGATYDLGEVIGERPVLVEFWATWCTICRVLDPKVAAARERFGDRVEFLVIAVGVAQTPERVREHVRRHPVAGRLLWDGRGAAARAFAAPGTGFIVVLDRNGKVVYTGTGTDQDLEGALARALD